MKQANWLMALAAALLGLVPALHAQAPVPELPGPAPLVNSAPPTMPVPTTLPPAPAVPGAIDGAVPSPAAAPPAVSSWLAYPRSPSCCGPAGRNGPIMGETYLRNGINVPLGTNKLTTDTNVGYTGSVGFRTLLFNPDVNRAWVVDFGLSSTWNSISNASTFQLIGVPVTTTINGQSLTTVLPIQNVVPIRMNMTTANLSLGQEYYLWGCAACDGSSKFRIGWDAGGRYGDMRLDLAGLRHRTDVVGGFFAALHGDCEVPFGCCLFTFGGRVEYNCMFNDILQSRNESDVMSINVLITTGLRF